MLALRWRRGTLAAAIVLLAAFGVAFVEDALLHTDDGCRVEQHCLACQWHHGAVATPATFTAVGAPLRATGLVTIPQLLVCLEARLVETPSRAPPLA